MARKKSIATIADAVAAKKPAATSETPRVLRFVVEQDPVGKERARVFSRATTDGRVITRGVTPEKTRAYEWHVRTMAQIAVNQSKWCWADDDRFTTLYRIFTRHRLRHPDAVNVIKAIEDACNGVIWRDDALVLDGAWTMRRDAERPRVEVEVRRWKESA